MVLDVLYFAWLRERIGVPRERVETSAATVRDLVAELVARGMVSCDSFAGLRARRGRGARACRHLHDR